MKPQRAKTMITPQIFFKSSCQIDVGIKSQPNQSNLGNESKRESSDEMQQEARKILDELRERLRSAEGVCFKMSQESKQRLVKRFSEQ